MAIVRGSVAMTYPSRYEGFGLPVLEAMGVGAPVLAADATSLPELVDDAGTLVPAEDPDAWSAAMFAALADGGESERMIANGRARAAEYTWEAVATQTVAAYRDVAKAARDDIDDDGVAS
jgi:alpha-1,3-rhamnosyl/mannosyltransferase